jgi:RHS repeat-associated protein
MSLPVRTIARLASILSFAFLVLCTPAISLAQPPPANEVTEYYGLDALGSVRIVFDGNGSVVARLDYAPFGRELSPGGNAPDRKFAQLFRDGETGLDYAQVRSYQARTGRFTSPDSVYAGLFEPQNWNRYSYSLNNAATLRDPSGLDPENFQCGSSSCSMTESVKVAANRSALDGRSSGDFGGTGGFAGLGQGAEFMLMADVPQSGDTSSWLDGLQSALDLASIALDATGLGGAVSWVPDAANAAISLGRGDTAGAGLSAAGAIPFVGSAANAARLARRGVASLPEAVMNGHHLLPREFEPFFKGAGIKDINEFLVDLSRKHHLSGIHGKGDSLTPGWWNDVWRAWIGNNPNASDKEIFQQLGRMMDDYGINHLPVHPKK